MTTTIRTVYSFVSVLLFLLSAGCGEEAGKTKSEFDRENEGIRIMPGRSNHTSVWTGTGMIVFGGFTKTLGYPLQNGFVQGDYTTPNDVIEYNPSSNAWRTITSFNGTVSGHSAVWTGSDMIVWGGMASTATGSTNVITLITGTRYHPQSGIWSSVSTSNAPSARSNHTALWGEPASNTTGTAAPVMLIWGGVDSAQTPLNNGARYDPAADTWAPVSAANAPSPRIGYSAVWTGKEMIVWGGLQHNPGGSKILVNTGSRYDPISDIWSAVSVTGAPSPRNNHVSVWTGSEMIILGGSDENFLNSPYVDGARYDPLTDTWTWMRLATRSYSYQQTQSPRAIWTGSRMIVLSDALSAIYDPAENSWSPIYPSSDLKRWSATVLWDGTDMILWGGQAQDGRLYNTGIRYNPPNNLWSWTSILLY